MTVSKTTTPQPEPGCRICFAADRGRSAARMKRHNGRVESFAAIIAAHPHRNDATQRGSA